MKKPDLLILIAIWEFITAFLAFIGLLAIALFAFPAVFQTWGRTYLAGIFGLSVASLLVLGYLSVAVTSGIGLIIGKEWGRILAIVHAALSLVSIPIGTALGILSLIYLAKAEVKEYFLTADKDASLLQQPKTS